jgi:putative hydrolase of the HAD superfamily
LASAREAVWYACDMVRAITLDFWNTLVEDHAYEARTSLRAERLAAALRPHGFKGDRRDVDRAFKASWDNFDRLWHDEHRTPTTAESMTVVLGSLKVKVDRETHAALTRQMEDLVLDLPPRAIAGVKETIPRLADDYALAVVCDAGLSPGRTLRQVLAAHGLEQNFGYLFFSDEHGFSKPDPRAFRTALEALGVEPHEAVHVGDIQRTDIGGAHAAGMRALHFAAVNGSDVPRSTAEAIVYRFSDLPAAIAALG